MQRRSFLTAALAASATAITPGISAQTSSAREYYQFRKYVLRSGPQARLADAYFGDALIPALNRLGLSPIGAFKVTFGPQTPTTYLLIPGTNLETVANVDLLLAKDEQFLKAAEPFWSAPAKEPPFERIESTLLKAFEGYPKVTPPSTKAPKRVFQLRTYESPSPSDHIRKVEMFHHGEFRIFERSGCGNVFFGDALVGPNLPKLTYMLTFPDLDALNAGWEKFFADPEWKKLAADPRYSFEAIVNNIDSLILAPASYSQV